MAALLQRFLQPSRGLGLGKGPVERGGLSTPNMGSAMGIYSVLNVAISRQSQLAV